MSQGQTHQYEPGCECDSCTHTRARFNNAMEPYYKLDNDADFHLIMGLVCIVIAIVLLIFGVLIWVVADVNWTFTLYWIAFVVSVWGIYHNFKKSSACYEKYLEGKHKYRKQILGCEE